MTSNVIVQSQSGLSDLAFPIEFAATVGRIMTSAEREAELRRVRPEFDMLTVLSSADGSQLAVNIKSLISMVWEVNRLIDIKRAKMRNPSTPSEFVRFMETGGDISLERIRSELRWRCNHDHGFRHGLCKCCEMNELFTSEGHLAARKIQRDGFGKHKWKRMAFTWNWAREYCKTW